MCVSLGGGGGTREGVWLHFVTVCDQMSVCLAGEHKEEAQLLASHNGGAQDPRSERPVGGHGGEGM